MNLRLILKKKIKGIRFKQAEERSLKELFSQNQNYEKKISKEFLAEGHRRVSSPFLVIFMSLAAAFTILLGNSKQSNTTKRISFIISYCCIFQAIYIVVLIQLIFLNKYFNFLFSIRIIDNYSYFTNRV